MFFNKNKLSILFTSSSARKDKLTEPILLLNKKRRGKFNVVFLSTAYLIGVSAVIQRLLLFLL
jgi:hypothetical protein